MEKYIKIMYVILGTFVKLQNWLDNFGCREKNLQKGKQYLFYLKINRKRWVGDFLRRKYKEKIP